MVSRQAEPVTLDFLPAQRRLVRGSRSVPLGPRPLKLLDILHRKGGRIVKRDETLRHLGIYRADYNVLEGVVHELRAAFKNCGVNCEVVLTHRGDGHSLTELIRINRRDPEDISDDTPFESVSDPHLLLLKARHEYAAGDYWRAYGAAEKSARLFEEQGAHTLAVDACTEAISAARPQRDGARAAHIAKFVARLCSEQLIGKPARWLFLDRFALSLYDYARFEESLLAIETATDILKRLSTDPEDPQTRKSDKENSLRRRVLIEATSGRLHQSQHARKQRRTLEDYGADFRQRRAMNSFATTFDVLGHVTTNVLHDPVRAHEYTQRVLDHASEITHKWVLMELRFREAEFYSRVANDRPAAVHEFVEAAKLHLETGAVLEPISGRPDILRTPHAIASALGISKSELLEHSIDLGAPATQKQFPLDASEVRALVRAIAFAA